MHTKEGLKQLIDDIPFAIGSMYRRFRAGEITIEDFRTYRDTLNEAWLIAYVKCINC